MAYDGPSVFYSHSDHADLLAAAGSISDEGGVGHLTSTEHGSRELGLETIRDGKGVVLVCTNVGGVAALR